MAQGTGAISREERALLDIARLELDPSRGRRVAPITRGPLFAILCLGLLAMVVPFWVLWRKLRAFFKGASGVRH